MLRILYFARLREAFGCELEEMPLPGGVATVSGLMDKLMRRGGVWEEQLLRPYRVAVNQDLAAADTPVRDGDEVAVFPPVTGG
jgi:sulfur-carrier protein